MVSPVQLFRPGVKREVLQAVPALWPDSDRRRQVTRCCDFVSCCILLSAKFFGVFETSAKAPRALISVPGTITKAVSLIRQNKRTRGGTELCAIICCAASNLTVYYNTENLVKIQVTQVTEG